MQNYLEKPLVSIVIPTYNRAELVTQTIDSVVQQSYPNLEIIIVDDGSTDDTENTIQNIKDSRIRYIKHPQNLGGATARNTGIEAATGGYTCFLDSDDLWLPNKIELQLAFIQQFPDSEKIVTYTQRKISNPHKEVYKNRSKVTQKPNTDIKYSKNLADYLFCDDGDMQTSTLMMKSAFAKAVKFRSELKKHQDWDFCLRLEARGAIFAFLPQTLTIYQNHSCQNRTSRKVDYNTSINWIKEYASVISAKAHTGFLLQELFPKLFFNRENRLYAQKIIFDAWRHEIITLSEFKNTSDRLWGYSQFKQKIKLKILKIFKLKKLSDKFYS